MPAGPKVTEGDHRQIEELIYAYAARMDRGDFDGVAELFAEATYGAAGQPPLRGREQIQRVLCRSVKLYDGSPRTKHVTTNVVVEIAWDSLAARAHSYFQVLQSVPGSGLSTVAAGRYEDRFSCRDERWWFAERTIHMDLLGDVSAHLTIDLAGPT